VDKLKSTSPHRSQWGKLLACHPLRKGGGWLVFVAILLGTAALSTLVYRDNQAQARQRFEYRAEQERSRILFRLTAHLQVLRSAAALFAVSDQSAERNGTTI